VVRCDRTRFIATSSRKAGWSATMQSDNKPQIAVDPNLAAEQAQAQKTLDR
jgi:hypothetical protein